MDSTTRRLRAFIALAEHRHFGRAAAEIFVTQQALSKQIAALEAEVGISLVCRSTREVELTAAGELFLAACRDALRAFDAGVDMTRGGPGILRLGFFTFAALELTDRIVDSFRARRPGTEIVMRQFTFLDPTGGLTDRSSDIAIVRLPLSMPGLRYQRLFVEPRVAAVSTDHRLADRESLSAADILDERLTTSGGPDNAYRRFWTLGEHRSCPMAPPIVTRSHAEELEIVAAGRAISVTSAAAARLTAHAGVRFIPIRDIPGTTCVMAWRDDEETEVIRDFADATRAVLEHEPETVNLIEHPQL